MTDFDTPVLDAGAQERLDAAARRKQQQDALTQMQLANARQSVENDNTTATTRTMTGDAALWAHHPAYAGTDYAHAPAEAKQHFIDAYGGIGAAQAPKMWNDAQTAATGVVTGAPIVKPTSGQITAGSKMGIPYAGESQEEYMGKIAAKSAAPQFDSFTTPQQAFEALERQQKGLGDVAKQIAGYQAPLTVLGRYPANAKTAIISAIRAINPDFQETEYGARQKAKNDFTPGGSQGANISSANTLVGHLAGLKEAADALHAGNIRPLNYIKQAGQNALGESPITNFESKRNAVASELAKLFKGGNAAPTAAEIEHFRNVISPNMSPQQMDESIKSYVDMMKTRMGALQDQWNQTVKMPRDVPFLSTQSRAKLRQLGINPDEVDSPTATAPAQQAQPAEAKAAEPEPTATNPKTGEKIVFRNGAWQPLK